MISKDLYQNNATKGVAAVIGFLLVFSFLILAAAQYQTTVIPIQEENTEIQHSQEVRGQLTSLQSEIRGTASSNEVRTQELQLGTTFESRLIFGIIPAIHQPAPPGSLEYIEAKDDDDGDGDGDGVYIQVDNAVGQRGAEEFWDGSQVAYPNENTGWLVYEAEYRHYQSAPKTVYENGIVYDEYSDGTIVYRSDQNIVSNNNITITSLGGDTNVNTVGSRTVESHPVSAPRTRIAVRAPAGDNLRVRLPTRLSDDQWRDLLEEERDINGGNVTSISQVIDDDGNEVDAVDIRFRSGETYTIGLARTYVTTRLSDSPIPQTNSEYIAWDDDEVILRERSKTKIEAQVRDKYNNPIPGQQIEAFARDSTGTCIGNFDSAVGPSGPCTTNVDQPGKQTSANEGRVVFIYEAPEVNKDTQIDITLQFP